MIIKNRDQLAISELRQNALDIIEAGIERVLPSTIMLSAVSFDRNTRIFSINNDSFKLSDRLFVIGGGKASGLMAQTLEKLIGSEVITDGVVIEKAAPGIFSTRSIRILQAGHPFPDACGVEAMNELMHLKSKYSISAEDLVFCLISGGGSSLMPSPLESISLYDKQEVTRLLLASGANIVEINSVRKHLSKTKGGRLAQYFAPARIISLILSDVIGNDLSTIASGPTHPDSSTFLDACSILDSYKILDKVPLSVRKVMEKGYCGEIAETPKSLENVHNYIIGDVRIALEAMAEEACKLGYNPLIISSEQTGDTEKVADQRAREILGDCHPGYNALLIGGETTPTLPDKPGKGGRNQHFAVASIFTNIPCKREWVLAAVGTDGSDFLPDVAGAIVDDKSLAEIQCHDISLKQYVERYDSNTLLEIMGHSIITTGSTGTNVGDIILYLFKK